MLKVGKHCDFCNQNDFLPFQCRKCSKLCCLEHRDTHPCVAETPNEPVPDRRPAVPRPKKVYKQPDLKTVPPKQPAKTPEKQNALERLRAYMATKPQRSYKSSGKSEPKSGPKSGSEAIGDESVPISSRYFVHIRRPALEIKDALTGEQVTRPEKTVLVFYDKTKPIGYALDRAKKTLGVTSATSFRLNGTSIPSSSPIGAIPPSSTLDLI